LVIKQKRILILTADAGFGHRSAANAINEALLSRHGDEITSEIINPLDDKRAPLVLRESQSDYDKWVRKAPELYKFGYEASDRPLPSAIAESALTVGMFELMRDILRTHRPDVVVSTYPLYQSAITGVLAVFKAKIPFITVVTDLATVHRLWFNDKVDELLVPTEVVRSLALQSGVDPKKIHITGIPIHPEIVEDTRPTVDFRRELGWDPDLFTILAVGSKRVEGMMDALNVINHFGQPLQLAVVSGKDDEMYAELQRIEWHHPTYLFQFVDNMPQLMHAADLMVCKAGGLIVTESLACKLPMVLINVLPGQEKGNMEYVVDNGAGVLAEAPMQVLEALAHYTMGNRSMLTAASQAAEKIGKPMAAFDVAERIWQAAQWPTFEPDLSFRNSLIHLLRQNQIPYNEDESLTTLETPD